MAKIKLTGGHFQDAEGAPLANGFLKMTLSHDEMESADPGQVCAALTVTVPLDASGSVDGDVYVWPNNELQPSGSFYIVEAFGSDGMPVWKAPQYFTVPDSSGTFDVGTWVPLNPPGPDLTGGSSSPVLQTNGVNNGSQTLLNLVAGDNTTLSNSGGDVTITALGGGGGLELYDQDGRKAEAEDYHMVYVDGLVFNSGNSYTLVGSAAYRNKYVYSVMAWVRDSSTGAVFWPSITKVSGTTFTATLAGHDGSSIYYIAYPIFPPD